MFHSRLDNYTVWYENKQEFRELKREVWGSHSYYVDLDNVRPKIIDIGAHIGMTSLYYAKQYPGATIDAYEPNPLVLPLLEKNIFENMLSDRVHVHNQAVTFAGGSAVLYHESMSSDWQMNANLLGATWIGEPLPEQSVIESVAFADVVGEGADIVKIDVEGAEHELLAQSGAVLEKVQNIVLEYHPHEGATLAGTVALLEDCGFECEVWKGAKQVKHFKTHTGLALILGRK